MSTEMAERKYRDMREMQQEAGGAKGIPCNNCGRTESRVWTTRPWEGYIRRERVCIHCGHSTFTKEQVH